VHPRHVRRERNDAATEAGACGSTWAHDRLH
jgi:hypothetical protein